MKRHRGRNKQVRRGAITVLAAIMAIVLVAMVAFCVDIGYVLSAKEDLQRSADASALAACWEYGLQLAKGNSSSVATSYARTTAAQYAVAQYRIRPRDVDGHEREQRSGWRCRIRLHRRLQQLAEARFRPITPMGLTR